MLKPGKAVDYKRTKSVCISRIMCAFVKVLKTKNCYSKCLHVVYFLHSTPQVRVFLIKDKN